MRSTDHPHPPPLSVPFSSSGSALREAARQYVVDGEPLATFLGDLELAHELLKLPPPSTDVVKAASLAWADEFLGRLDGVACENPLTGMSTGEHALVHLRTLYRTGDTARTARVLAGHALVIVSLFHLDPATPKAHDLETAFDESLKLATVAETIRATFERCDVIAALEGGRVLALVERDEFVENRVDELSWLLRRRLPISSVPRVLVEPMPETEEGACALLDELTA